MQALPGLAQDVAAEVLGDRRLAVDEPVRDVRIQDELLLLALLPQQVDGEHRPVDALPDPAEPDERHLRSIASRNARFSAWFGSSPRHL